MPGGQVRHMMNSLGQSSSELSSQRPEVDFPLNHGRCGSGKERGGQKCQIVNREDVHSLESLWRLYELEVSHSYSSTSFPITQR